MLRATSILICILAPAPLFALAACSSSNPPPPTGTTCQAYAPNTNLPASAFAKDVLPIFQQSCGVGGASCHGDPMPTSDLRPYLASPDGGTDPAQVIARIVGTKSAEDPSMNLVTAGDPANSFLMHKMDGDQCTLAQQCGASQYNMSYPNCGQIMPQSLAMPLPTDTRDKVRAWIKQGAMNN